jgi:hypothetical protein
MLEKEVERLAHDRLARAIETVSASIERLGSHEFAALRRAQESTAAALTDAIVRLSQIEAEFVYAPPAPISGPNAAEITSPLIPKRPRNRTSCSILRLFRNFQSFSPSSAGNHSRFCGAEAATVSDCVNFTIAATATRTL